MSLLERAQKISQDRDDRLKRLWTSEKQRIIVAITNKILAAAEYHNYTIIKVWDYASKDWSPYMRTADREAEILAYFRDEGLKLYPNEYSSEVRVEWRR